MNNFALGKYMPLNSPIHRMDPRAKIMAMLIVLIAIFFPAGFSRLCDHRCLRRRGRTDREAEPELCLAVDEAHVVHAAVSADRQHSRAAHRRAVGHNIWLHDLQRRGIPDVIYRNPVNVDDHHHDGVNRNDQTAGSDVGD